MSTATLRELVSADADSSIVALRVRGHADPYALEASVMHDGLTYSRDYPLDGTPNTTNRQLAAARAWCKAMTADLAARLTPQEAAQ